MLTKKLNKVDNAGKRKVECGRYGAGRRKQKDISNSFNDLRKTQ
jgi:hypothetical protein